MNGSFACPECGGIVKLRGLAPGRQVRCKFCRQLVEIPYLPRVPSPTKRPGYPKWVIWSWSAVGLAITVILVWGSLRFWRNYHQSLRTASIDKMIASSQAHELAGHLNEALIELDAALELARQAGESLRTTWDQQRKRRQDLARREVEETLDGLVHHGASSLPLGDWLNLIARSEADPDLEPLRLPIARQFRSRVGQHVDGELASAQRSFQSGQVVNALQSCDRIAKLLKHLDPDSQQARRSVAEKLVTSLLASHGVLVDLTHGDFVFGSETTYAAQLEPVVVKALEAKDYLPYRANSPWADLWKHALYRMEVHVHEQREGYYPSSQSRLTLIRVHLTLIAQGVQKWQQFPGARSRVPLRDLPAGLAVQSDQSEEIERRLYKDALGQLDDKVSLALTNLPACPP